MQLFGKFYNNLNCETCIRPSASLLHKQTNEWTKKLNGFMITTLCEPILIFPSILTWWHFTFMKYSHVYAIKQCNWEFIPSSQIYSRARGVEREIKLIISVVNYILWPYPTQIKSYKQTTYNLSMYFRFSDAVTHRESREQKSGKELKILFSTDSKMLFIYEVINANCN